MSDGIFATLADAEIERELAAERIAAARWHDAAPEREQVEHDRDNHELVMRARSLDGERAWALRLPHKLYNAIRYIEASLYDGPMTSTDLDAGRGDISERTYRRARAWLTASGELRAEQRSNGAWWLRLVQAANPGGRSAYKVRDTFPRPHVQAAKDKG